MKLATVLHEGRPTVAIVDPAKQLFWPLDEAVPQHPVIFAKPSSSIAGPFDDIPLWPGLDGAVDLATGRANAA